MSTIHAWEFAGLGRAPFRVSGLYSIPSPSLAEVNVSAYNAALARMPNGVGVGTCAVCGTALVHNFIIGSADGRKFAVGCDCVSKSGDAGLIDAVSARKRKAAREARAAAAEAARAANVAGQRERNGGLTDFEAIQLAVSTARAERALKFAWLAPIASGDFGRSIMSDLENGKELSQLSAHATNIVRDIYCKSFGRKGSAGYVAAGQEFEKRLRDVCAPSK